MSSYHVTSLDELDRIPVSHGLEWRPIRRRLGIRAFGINAYTAEKVGDCVVEEHTEEQLGHEEVYVVVSGRARFTLGDEVIDAPAGTLVYIGNPETTRVAIAEEPGTTVLAVGGAPGKVFEPSPWEWFFAAAGKEPEEAIAIMEDGLTECGEYPALLYHLARYESQAGRADEAAAHLQRAIELRPDLREHAEQDGDLKGLLPIAGEP